MTAAAVASVVFMLLAGLVPTLLLVASVLGARWQRALVAVTPAPLGERLVVIVPARNESMRLPSTLSTLCADPSPLLRVLVVDDRSTDDTAARVQAVAAHDTRVHLLRLYDDPPAGVFGKPRALQAASDEAARLFPDATRWLFLDADVELAPGALGGLLHAMTASGAHALSGLPRIVCDSVVEKAVVPTFVALVGARHPVGRVHRADDAAAFLNGQILLVERASLERVGGFASVQHTVLEDVALARVLKGQGAALRLADLRTIASTRMYTSLREIVDGFGKNARALFGRGAAQQAVLGLVLAWLPWALCVVALGRGDVQAQGAAILGLIATLMLQARARALAAQPMWTALLVPPGWCVVAFVLVRAALTSTVRWRGRAYRV